VEWGRKKEVMKPLAKCFFLQEKLRSRRGKSIFQAELNFSPSLPKEILIAPRCNREGGSSGAGK